MIEVLEMNVILRDGVDEGVSLLEVHVHDGVDDELLDC